MSKIPKPKTIPKPKSIREPDDVGTPEHQDLLDWTWNNLEDLLVQVFTVNDAVVAEKKRMAIKDYEVAKSELCRKLRKAMEDPKHAEHAQGIETALRRAEKSVEKGSTELPELPDDAFSAKLVDKHYQQPISVTKYDRHGDRREEVVGFIDIEAKVSFPDHVALIGVPKLYSLFASSTDYVEAVIQEPEWVTEREQFARRVWIDVRADAPQLAVLLRELRVLRDLAGTRAHILVVANRIPDLMWETLLHEGFIPVEREQWEPILQGRET